MPAQSSVGAAQHLSRPRVLFLCTHNSARSQMAEGLLRASAPDRFESFSAGTVATSVRPEAIAVMSEVGVDISGHRSKTLDRYVYEPIDTVVTVCDSARDSCPVFFGAKRSLHWSVEDPSSVIGAPDVQLAAFREAREVLEEKIRSEFLAGQPTGVCEEE